MSDGNGVVGDTEDRISSLPNELLTSILSLLSMKTVVSTSVLSRRWTPLWATIPSLELNVSDFLPRGYDLTSQTRQKANFLAFVERFLRQNSPCNIDELCLNCLDGRVSSDISNIRLVWSKIDPRDHQNHPLFPEEMFQPSQSNLESWIRLAQRFKARKLFICSNTDLLVRPNFSMFESLLRLELMGSMVLNIKEGSIFPNLKVLILDDIIIKGDKSVSNLINSCCPVLEELFVISYDENDLPHLVVTAKRLRRLHLEFLADDINICSTISATRVDFSTLRYLYLRNVLITDNQSGVLLAGLEEAELNVFSEDYNVLFWLLTMIRNVKKLTLSEFTLVSLASCTLPTFDYLTSLVIKDLDNDIACWETLIFVLKKSPMLKDLRLEGIFHLALQECLTGHHTITSQDV